MEDYIKMVNVYAQLECIGKKILKYVKKLYNLLSALKSLIPNGMEPNVSVCQVSNRMVYLVSVMDLTWDQSVIVIYNYRWPCLPAV